MQVIPAVDISEGKCVRLKQGDMNQKTVFSDDPAQMADRWANRGAPLIHIVDLDGAVGGSSANLDAVLSIIQTILIPVELGGGLRTREDVARVLDLGVRWVVMGTSALADRPELEKCLEEFGERIIVGIDARDGRVAAQGWTQTTDVEAVALAREMEEIGVQKIIFTDIGADGMLAGPNAGTFAEVAEAVSIPIIAAGGITTLDDIRKLKLLEDFGVAGCIIGRALYSGTIDLKEAIRVGAE